MRRLFALVLCVLAWPTAARPVTHLTFVERPEQETLLHRGAAEDALGDVIVFDNPLYDAADRTLLGQSSGQCVRTTLGVAWSCQITLSLKDGSLEASGRYADEGDSELAVTGGSGRYLGARGAMTVHPKDAAHHRYDFRLTLLADPATR